MPACFLKLPLRFHRPWLIVVTALTAVLLVGCEPAPKIRQYTVPKLAVSSSAPKDEQTASQPRTMVGAIVLAGPNAWFFKVTGDPGAVAQQRDEVTKFVRGVTFSADGQPPRWELPEGWKQLPGDSIRFATIQIAGATPPPELTVTSLPRGENDEEYILQNVNRWRKQLGLGETTSEALAKEAERFTIGEFPCTLVEFTGTGSGSMGGPFSGAPFADGPPKDHPAIPDRSQPPPNADEPKLSFETPSGWTKLPLAAGGLRRASFEVIHDKRKLDVSVTDLALQGGDVPGNVNRWRQQVGLPQQTAAEIEKSLETIGAHGIEWKLVELVGPGQGEVAGDTILGAIGNTGKAAWFVKLKGDPELAQREKERFKQFVASLQVE